LFRTKTDKQEIDFNGTPESLLMMKLRIQNTELNTTTARLERKRSSLSLSLSLSLFAKGSPLSVWPQQRGATTRRAQKKQNNIKRRRRVSANEILSFVANEIP